MFETYWRPWDPEKKDLWVRDLPGRYFGADEFDWIKPTTSDYDFQTQFPGRYHRRQDAKRTTLLDGKDISNRMASTIRHNRARGTLSIDLIVSIVGELVAAGMKDDWILKHIGMDADELLRLKQISGIAAQFADREFNKAWAASTGDADFYEETE